MSERATPQQPTGLLISSEEFRVLRNAARDPAKCGLWSCSRLRELDKREAQMRMDHEA